MKMIRDGIYITSHCYFEWAYDLDKKDLQKLFDMVEDIKKFVNAKYVFLRKKKEGFVLEFRVDKDSVYE